MPIFNPILVGKKLPTLTTPGAASDLASGKQLIGQDGEIVTGTAQIPQICTVTIKVEQTVGDAVSVCTNSGTSTITPGGTSFFRLYANVGYGLVYSNTHSLPQVSVTSGTCNINQLATSNTRVFIPTSNCTLTVT